MKTQFEKIQIAKYMRANPPSNIVDLIHDLLSSEDKRVRLALKLTDDTVGAASLLNMSKRSVFRKVEIKDEQDEKGKE